MKMAVLSRSGLGQSFNCDASSFCDDDVIGNTYVEGFCYSCCHDEQCSPLKFHLHAYTCIAHAHTDTII